MQEIKGEKFYVSLGYVDEEKLKDNKPINAHEIKNIIMNIKDGSVYIDDSDKENYIRIPLMRIKEIQKKDGIFKFRYLFDSYKAFWVNDDKTKNHLMINVIGLFGQKKDNGTTIIRHIGFFTTQTKHYVTDSETTTFSLDVEESKILGE